MSSTRYALPSLTDERSLAPQMGAMKIGSPPAGIYPTDTPDQVVYKLDHSDSKARGRQSRS